MPQIKVVTDTSRYQKLLKLSSPERYHTMSDQELKALPGDAYILTGEKAKSYGGGPSPDGFVISGNKLCGRLRLAGRSVHNGKLTVL